ncbi:MAG: hypothetical protein MAG451_03010 [Anaerolineales bacterium]|nr:hypothetical protein [Anaerolineales bacterium]
MKIVNRMMAVVGVVVVFALTVTTVAADAPPSLDRTRTGSIVGNSGGAFEYYTFKHPGAGKLVKLRMTFSPWHPNKEGGIGFNLYAEQGKLAGQGVKVDSSSTELALAVAADFPTQYLVQVHNYYPGFRLGYSLRPEGLAEAQAEVGPPATDGAAQRPARLVHLAMGDVPGQRHGSFDFYELRHPGDENIWIKMVYYPNHWIIADGVGFNVYRGPERVAEGQALGLDRHIRWVKLAPAEPTTFLIQVYNYIPEILLDYRLAVTEQQVGP